jgi:hypothetical protein
VAEGEGFELSVRSLPRRRCRLLEVPPILDSETVPGKEGASACIGGMRVELQAAKNNSGSMRWDDREHAGN